MVGMIVALVSVPCSKHSIVAATVSAEAPKSSAFTTMRTDYSLQAVSDGPHVDRGSGKRAHPEADADAQEEQERGLDEGEGVERRHARSEPRRGDAAGRQQVARLTEPPPGRAGELDHSSPDEPDD